MGQHLPGQAPRHRGPARRLPAQEWATLQRGECLEVWSEDSFRYAAYVDDLALDGRFVWIIENGTGCRRLFVRGDSVDLYTFPEAGSIMTKISNGAFHG